MFNIFRKDILFHKTYLLGIGAGYALYIGFFFSRIRAGLVPSIIGPFLYAILPIILYSREDKFKSVAFGLSLPTTRRETIAARYLLGWALMLAVYLAGSTLIPLMPGSNSSFAVVFQVRAVLLTLTFMTLCFGTLMPLLVRFGVAGLMVPIVALQILGVILMIFRALVPLRIIRAAMTAIPQAIQAIETAAGSAAAVMAVLAILALFNFASFGISAALFARKDY